MPKLRSAAAVAGAALVELAARGRRRGPGRPCKSLQVGKRGRRQLGPPIVMTDVQASNGVIHVVDKVLLPK